MSRHVPELSENTGRFRTLARYHALRRTPFVLRQAAFLARPRAAWSDEYLDERIGHRLVPVAHTWGAESGTYRGFAGEYMGRGPLGVPVYAVHQVLQLPFHEFLLRAKGPRRSKFYAVVRDIHRTLPELDRDIERPPLLPASDEPTVNIWYGANRNTTLLHCDPLDNVLGVVRGTKDCYLFPPEAEVYRRDPWQGGFALLSRIEEAGTPEEMARSFPRFQWADAWRVTLHAGDALYLPAGWWHRVDSEPGLAINFWWSITRWQAVAWYARLAGSRGFVAHEVPRMLLELAPRLWARGQEPATTFVPPLALDARLTAGDAPPRRVSIRELSIAHATFCPADGAQVGAEATIEFELPLQPPHALSLHGKVAKVAPDEVVLELTPPKVTDVDLLMEFVSELESRHRADAPTHARA